MSLLQLVYWVLVILAAVGMFAPPTWPHGRRISGAALVVLFIIIGLHIFEVQIK